ncbi:MAG: hypothetical protein PHE89_07340 [Alphaproteobacteria bacterium]|nr:hypothetical protein [Alphaproteobacteria bacterium]
MKKLLYTFFGIVFLLPTSVKASNSLLYLEAQGIVGYSSMDKGVVYRSAHQHDTMQKNGVGFDYLQKFSGDYGDIGTGALQMRVVWDDDKQKFQAQTYNAYLKGKTELADVWAGHNRIAYGLSSYWDTHADLLQPLSMYGFGEDRDWGVGLNRDFEKSDFAFALTTGSGMGLRTKGNWLVTSRTSYGVLSQDNYNIGLSAMVGEKLDTMGYKLMSSDSKKIALGALDFAYNHGRFEHKVEADYGQKASSEAYAGFYRLGINFLDENRLKLEGQYAYTHEEGKNNQILGAGTTYKINADLTTRLMYQKEREMNNETVVFQLYYYFRY